MDYSGFTSTPVTARRSPARAKAIALRAESAAALRRIIALMMLMSVLVLLALTACARAETAAVAADPSYAFLNHPLPVSHSLSGNYLAGRFAQRRQDWGAAQTYIGEVAQRDNGNAAMQQRAFLLAVGAGQYIRAAHLADTINATDPAADVARIFSAAVALHDGQADAAVAQIQHLPEDGFGSFTKPLMGAWSLAAAGRFDEAQAMLSAGDSEGIESVMSFHRGLIAEMADDDNAATSAYMVSMREGLSLHSALIIASYFERKGAPQISRKIYEGIDQLFSVAPTLGVAPMVGAPTAKLTPEDGAALALFDVASLLYERRTYDSAQIYASIAQMLSPDLPYTRLMLGDIAALGTHYERALDHYAAIGKDSPLFWLSRLRVAEVYEVGGKLDDAATVLSDLAVEPRTRLPSLVALGDIYRRQGNFAAAREVYDRALDTKPGDDVKGGILFSRGMSLARIDQWPAAEKDLLAALELQPKNPVLLNFIGYSWMERGENASAAFDYIGRAVELKPNDGYILDSYGWAHYQQRDYDGAITWLEKAVAAVPGDATILDHLGDAYWKVGRQAEAQFQWTRAHDLTEDQALRSQVEGKLRRGLVSLPQPQSQLVQKGNGI